MEYVILLIAAALSESDVIHGFSAGELSPYLEARVDHQVYYSGCRDLENFICEPWGDIKKRPGTYYVSGADITLSVPEQLGDYPILNPTSPQADPGLPHVTAVSNLTDLENVNNNLDGNYYLTNDIDASATAVDGYQNYYEKKYGWWLDKNVGWGPIGLPFGAPAYIGGFTGTFDGCGYSITGLTIDGWNSVHEIGLFGDIEGDAKVANLTVEITFTAVNGGAGGLAGRADDPTANILIQNCHVSGTVNLRGSISEIGGLIGNSAGDASYDVQIYDCSTDMAITQTLAGAMRYVGGLTGRSSYSLIYNCFATGDINGAGHSNTEYIGGLCGRFGSSATMEYCYSTGDVEGAYFVGGLVGQYYGSGGYIRKCYSTGNVSWDTVNTSSYGGLIGGITQAGEVTDCYAWGNVTSNNCDGVGGFVGGVVTGSTFSQVYSIGLVTGTGNVGGLSGDVQSDGTFNVSYWDTQTSLQKTSGGGTGQTTTWLKTRPNFEAAGWDIGGEYGVNSPTIWYQEYTPPQEMDISDDPRRLIPFEHSTEQAYIISLGDYTLGVYK